MKTEYPHDACEALHRLLDVALAAKAAGHDCFISFTPHVRIAIEVRLFIDGWETGKTTDFQNLYIPMEADAITEAQTALIAAINTTTPAIVRARKLADINQRIERLEAERAALEAAS